MNSETGKETEKAKITIYKNNDLKVKVRSIFRSEKSLFDILYSIATLRLKESEKL